MRYNWDVKLPKKFFNSFSFKKVNSILKNKKKRDCLIRSFLYLIFFLFSAWLMWFTFQYKDGQFVMRSRLWSDFAAHLPMIRSFSYGSNFPPEYPQFANEPTRYHFLFYFLVGLIEKIGFNIAFSLNALSILGLTALLIMIFKIAEYFYGSDKKGAILAGVFAVIFFLFNSSLSYVDYFQENGVSLQSITNIINIDQFINFGPWNGDDISAFWHWNVYTNQRHLAFSFALSLLIMWPLITTKNKKQLSRKTTFFITLCFIFLPFLNLAAYVIAISMVIFWFLVNPSLVKKYALSYFVALIFSVPSFYYYWRLDSSSAVFSLGFLASDNNFWSIIHYWWRNLGLYLLFWPGLMIVSHKQLRKWLIMISCFFVAANLFQLSTDMINNHKLINFFQLGFAIVLGVHFSRLWHRSLILKIMVVCLIVPLTLSGVMDASAIIHDRQSFHFDPIYSDFGQWLLNETAADSVFITTQYLYNPVLLAGRKTYLDYGYFAWSMGYQDNIRREKLPEIFSPTVDKDQWCQLMVKERIDYIYISEGKGELSIDPRNSWLVLNNSPVFNDNKDLVFSVENICLSSNYSL